MTPKSTPHDFTVLPAVRENSDKLLSLHGYFLLYKRYKSLTNGYVHTTALVGLFVCSGQKAAGVVKHNIRRPSQKKCGT